MLNEFDKRQLPSILSDEPSQYPTLEFNRIAMNIHDIIISSPPQFTIGIYGDWGTGKTTLMKSIQTKFSQSVSENNDFRHNNDKRIINTTSMRFRLDVKKPHTVKEEFPTVWFNAWRYERENAKATIPLMITILDKLSIEAEKLLHSQDSWHKIKDKIKSFTRGCEVHFGIQFPFAQIDVTRKLDDDISIQIPKPTTQLGIDLIQELMESLIGNNSNFRMIVFVDDLDRCSSKKALEVFESVKILLNMYGIIYVIGLNQKTVEHLIGKEYENSNVQEGEYIRKIIQIPIWVPAWDNTSIEELLKNSVLPNVTKEHRDILDGKEKIISTVIQSNPRELKRFINSFIVSSEFLNNNGRSKNNNYYFLIAELIKFGWKQIYDILLSSNKNDVNQITSMMKILTIQDEFERKNQMNKWQNESKYSIRLVNLLSEQSFEFWNFLKKIDDVLFDINWSTYNTKRYVQEIPEQSDIHIERFYNLLKKGNVDEFNSLREKTNYSIIDFSKRSFKNMNLRKVVLSYVNLQNTKFENTFLSESFLVESNLSYADLGGIFLNASDLRYANLVSAHLRDATLTKANLQYADISNANLTNADLTDADLRDANLTGANLTGANLTGANLTGAKFDNTKTESAIYDKDTLTSYNNVQKKKKFTSHFRKK